jgi:hypothetical protein
MTLAILGRPTNPGAPAPQSVRELVIHWMQEWVWRGFPIDEASVKTVAEVRAAGLVEEFLDDLGPSACQEFWRLGQRQARDGRAFTEADDGDADGAEPAVVPHEPPGPRAAGTLLKQSQGSASLFDWMMVRIAGEWRSVGELHRVDAEALAAGYARRKDAMAGKEEVWRRIAEELGDQKIRDRYTEDELRALLKGAR